MWNEEQWEIIRSETKRKQVIAAAGSGKTATMIGILQFREEKKTIPPERTLLLTFTNQAVDELKERINKNNLSKNYTVSTFHAFCYRSLLQFHPEFSRTGISILTDGEKEKLAKEILYKHRWKVGGIPFAILFSGNYSVLRREFPEVYESFLFEIQNFKKLNHKFEFEDLIEIVKQALEKKEKWVLPLTTKFDSIILDEFQDVDMRQLETVQLLQISQITIVGDDWQAIYGFRGASTEPFLRFSEFFPGTKIFRLTTNYRSLKGIVDLSAIPIGKNKNQIGKKVISHRKGEIYYRTQTLKHPKKDLSSSASFWKTHWNDQESILLVRSNFRKKEWVSAGVSESKIMTIHASKGLEFGTVILDLSAGWNLTGKEDRTIIEEERRVLYVGLSRAKDKLILIGREKQKFKQRLEDEFFSYFPKTNSQGKLTLRSYCLW